MNCSKKSGNFNTKNVIKLSIVGAVVGIVNGFFGGGGGMIVVPLLINVLKKKVEEAHATALVIILPITIVSAILYGVFGNIEVGFLLPVGVGVFIGGIIGSFLLNKIKSKTISIIFSLVMMVAGVKMIFF